MNQEILEHLAQQDAVLTGSHFIYTSGAHGTAYINMRAVAHQAWWLSMVSNELAERIDSYDVDLVLGPETLGRTLAQYTALGVKGEGIWCDILEEGGRKHASFSPKLGFDRLIEGKRIAIVDDLLTTGSSIKLVADLASAVGGVLVVAAVVVRRTPDITAESCGVPQLEVLADIPGFSIFSPEECELKGPCSERVPVVLRPGHGHSWIKDHPGYPTA